MQITVRTKEFGEAIDVKTYENKIEDFVLDYCAKKYKIKRNSLEELFNDNNEDFVDINDFLSDIDYEDTRKYFYKKFGRNWIKVVFEDCYSVTTDYVNYIKALDNCFSDGAYKEDYLIWNCYESIFDKIKTGFYISTEKMTKDEVLNFIKINKPGGYSDWRFATFNEIKTLNEDINGFICCFNAEFPFEKNKKYLVDEGNAVALISSDTKKSSAKKDEVYYFVLVR